MAGKTERREGRFLANTKDAFRSQYRREEGGGGRGRDGAGVGGGWGSAWHVSARDIKERDAGDGVAARPGIQTGISKPFTSERGASDRERTNFREHESPSSDCSHPVVSSTRSTLYERRFFLFFFFLYRR